MRASTMLAIVRRLDEGNPPGATTVARVANETLWRPLRRRGLARRLRRLARLPGLTAVIGVRDRAGARLRNLLRSLDEQSARRDLRILLVDYGSRPEVSAELTRLAAEARAEVLRVDAADGWNRAAALNAGLRRVLTTHVLCADADLVFERSYVEIALRRLVEDPRRVVVSTMLDLPEGHAETITTEGFAAARAAARARYDAPHHPSIIALSTAALIAVGGYDETYRLWGHEDVDLFTRLRSFGLDVCDVHAETAYLHQWHAKHDGVAGDDFDQQVRANQLHFERRRSARRASAGKRTKVIVSAAGPNLWPLLESCSLPTFWRFAERHGYDVLPVRLETDRAGPHGAETNTARFAKLPLLRQALEEYELVLWLDADVMICRFDDDIARHLGDGKFQAFALEQVPQDRRVNPNSGVWLLRQGRAARRFLRAVERAGQQPGPWADQAAIMKVLGWDRGTTIYHDAGPGMGSGHLAGTGWLPPSWNQLHGVPGEDADGVHAVPRVRRPYAIHFAGMRNEERAPLMRDLLQRISAG